ncbi:MAG: hypothetical protein ACT4P4_06885 [Betaproteobacteria bacterium]
MLALERPDLAPRVLRAALLTLAALIALEFVAFYGFRQNALERMQFGYARDAGFKEENARLLIRRSSSRALWDQSYPIAKPAGAARVMLVGDSILRGGSYEDSAAGRLRRDLEKCGVQAEVWNLSSPGYGSQRKHIMVEKALEYRPDLVVYQANVTTEYEDSREFERKERHASWHPGFWPEKLPLIGRIALSKNEQVFWKWLDREVRAGLDPGGADLEQALRSKSDIDYWMPRMLANFRKTTGLLKEARVPLLVLARASLVDDTDEMTDFGLEAAIDAVAREDGFARLSTRTIFAQGDARKYFFDGTHWTHAGHQLVGAALLSESLRLLGKPCGR